MQKNILELIPGRTEGDFSRFASIVSGWTYNEPDISPRTIEKVISYFNAGRSVLLIDAMSGILLSHAAVKWISTINPVLEIGTVIVNPKFRGKGYGTAVTAAAWKLAEENYPNYIKIAFCNDVSLGIFMFLGAKLALKDELPSEVWDGCIKCQKKILAEKMRKNCCDTVVTLPNIEPKLL